MNEKEDVTLLKKSFNNFSVDKNLIETSNQRILASTQEKYDNLVNNNRNVISSQLCIVELCLDNHVYAPVLYFHVLFLLEVLLKHLMFINCGVDKYKEVDCSHSINNYIDELYHFDEVAFKELRTILQDAKYFNEYASLRYNFRISDKSIIVKEKDYKEVIEYAEEILQWMRPFLEKI